MKKASVYRSAAKQFTYLIVASLFLSIPLAASVAQKPPKTAQAAPGIPDPAALALRDRVAAAYRDVRSLHEKVTQRQWTIRPENALTITYELRFRRPNKIYLAIDYPEVGKDGRWQLIYACDGKTLTVYNSARNEYQSVKSPARLDRVVLPATLRGPEFIALLRDISPFEQIEKSAAVRYSEIFETGPDGSRHALRLDLRQDSADRTLNYRLGAKDNLVHGYSITILPEPDSGNPFADPEVRSSVLATYDLIDTSPRFSDSDFRYAPPAGAKERKTEHASAERHDEPQSRVSSGAR